MRCKGTFSFIIFLFVATYLERTNGVAVMSVDIGSEWLKVAIVSPGVPMEIALNKESKRKTPMTISFRDNERSFGEDAQMVGLRFPKSSFSYFVDLLGKSIDNPIVELYKERFPYYDIISDEERRTIEFRVNDNTTFSPEELLAQMLEKGREFGENSAGQKINDAVITVPPFFNQIERRAVLQAAELANIKVLQLLNANTAIALNYGIFRRKEINDTTQYIMFYDMGSSTTTATVVGYQNVKSKEKGFVEATPQVGVLGVGYDRTLGGLEVQTRLRNYLAAEFDKMGKISKSVLDNPRAMAKLFKEAGRVKNILSANNEHYAQVEGLVDEKDFRLLVTREKLEELCSDLFRRFALPIKMALDTSALTMDLISQVVLVGAGTRMPKVQEKLTEIIKTELAKNINTDEAAVLGAVYKAADLSQGFKVKKFITRDAVLFPIQIVFDRTVDGKTKQVRKTLFSKVNAYPQKKIITFNKHKDDFEFGIHYSELDHLPKHEQEALGPLTLAHVALTGVAEAHEKHAQENAESKGIRAHFFMDDSGILNLQNVELISEKTNQSGHDEEEEEGAFSKLGSTISKLFSGSDDEGGEKVEVNAKEDVKPVKEGNSESASLNFNKEDKANAQNRTKINDGKIANQTSKVEKKPTIITLKHKIDAYEKRYGPQALQGDKLQRSREKIDAFNRYDTEKTRRERALNSLEAFVIDAKQKMALDEYKAAATEQDVDNIAQTCDEIQDWLYEEGFDADADTYESKLQSVKKLTNDIYERVFEHRERPEALKGMASIINASIIFLKNMKNLTEAQEIFTLVEMETLERIINETQAYYNEIITAIEITALHEPVKHKVRDIANKMSILDREVKYLVNKAQIWKPKQEKRASNESKVPTDDSPETDQSPMSEATSDKEGVPVLSQDSIAEDKENLLDNEANQQDAEITDSSTNNGMSENDDKNGDSSHEEL